eukprot:jgi/Tetstr1/458227/TSEL_044715.t1
MFGRPAAPAAARGGSAAPPAARRRAAAPGAAAGCRPEAPAAIAKHVSGNDSDEGGISPIKKRTIYNFSHNLPSKPKQAVWNHLKDDIDTMLPQWFESGLMDDSDPRTQLRLVKDCVTTARKSTFHNIEFGEASLLSLAEYVFNAKNLRFKSDSNGTRTRIFARISHQGAVGCVKRTSPSRIST